MNPIKKICNPKLEVQMASNSEGEIREITSENLRENSEAKKPKLKWIDLFESSKKEFEDQLNATKNKRSREIFAPKPEEEIVDIDSEKTIQELEKKFIDLQFEKEIGRYIKVGDCTHDLVGTILSEEEVSTDEELDREIFDIGDQLKKMTHYVRDLKCTHQRGSVLRKCGCMVMFKTNPLVSSERKYYFDENALNDLQAIAQDLRVANMFKKSCTSKYKLHKVVIIALTTLDKDLECTKSVDRRRFLQILYEVREYYDRLMDYGEKATLLDDFHAQSFSSIVSDFLSAIKKFAGEAGSAAKDVVAFSMELIIKLLRALIGFISSSLSSIFKGVLERIRLQIIEWFDPVDVLKHKIAGVKHPILIAVVILLLITIVVDTLGIITYKITKSVIDSLFSYFDDDESNEAQFMAQAPTDPLAGVISVIALILGLTRYEFDVVSKKCRNILSIISAGVGCSWLMGSLFLLLPFAVRTAIKLKFGSQEEREREEIDEWVLKSSAVIRLKRIPKVLVSEDYFKWISELMTESLPLMKRIKSPTVSNLFVRNLVSLMEIVAILENYRKEKSYRSYPFSFHLCAPPGYGKTLLSSQLVHDLFGTKENEVYCRPVSSEFWDGFINQKVIILDEFLIGDKVVKDRIAMEYLELVSTKVFKPACASVDDPAVGKKGTVCEPIGVVTINNSAYERVTTVPDSAIHRRREFVIRLKINPKHQNKFVDNRVDFAQFTDEEISSKAWLVFDILPPLHNSNRARIENLSYGDLMTILRTKYQEHQDICARIEEGRTSCIELDRTPAELLDDTLRELRGIPNEPIGVTEALFGVFIDTKDVFSNIFTSESQAFDNDKPMDDSIFVEPVEEECKVIYKAMLRSRNKTSKTKIQSFMDRMCKVIQEGYDKAPKGSQLEDDYLKLTKLFAYFSGKWGTSHVIVIVDDNVVVMDPTPIHTEGKINSVPLLDNKNVLACIDHNNVVCEEIHQHACCGLIKTLLHDSNGNTIDDPGSEDGCAYEYRICQYIFAHKHSQEDVPHKMLCKTCVQSNREENFSEYNGSLPTTTPKRVATDLLPEDYDRHYWGEPTGYADRMNKMWFDIYMRQFTDYGKIPIVLLHFEDPNGVPYIHTSYDPRVHTKKAIKTVAKWVAVFSIVYAIKKLLTKIGGKKEEDAAPLCFAQSAKPNRVSTSRAKVKTFYKAQSKGMESVVKYEINGSNHIGYPIKGRTFMTYYHAFWKRNEQVPEGTLMTISYSGSKTSVPINYSMIQVDVENDLAFVTFFDNKMPQFPNNIKKFWTASDVEDFTSTSCLLEIQGNKCFATASKAYNKNYSHENRCIKLEECLLYRCPTKPGDCGYTVVSAGSNLPGKIMGMHVAGGLSQKDTFGVAVIVTQEDIISAISSKHDPMPDVEGAEFFAQSPEPIAGPNIEKIERIPSSDVIHVNRKSKYRLSSISCMLPNEPTKNLPILTASDSRNKFGIDPVELMLNDTASVDHSNDVIDERLVDRVFSDMKYFYDASLKWPIGRRNLSFEEALEGVPGKLASLNVRSSPGFPLCKMSSGGKSSFFNFVMGNQYGDLWFEPSFKEMVMQCAEKLETTDFELGRFLVFLKDELVSDKKIEECRTRLIYCGDLIANVAFRMKFGALLCAFNQSYETTPSAIGLNQYSHDMHMMYDYLSEVGENFIAGDFKNFDKNIQPYFQKSAYKLVMDLAGDMASDIVKDNFCNHQMNSPVQFQDKLIYFKHTHFSGCFLTSIINNLVHEAYIRYIFAKLCPNERFYKNIRLKVLGDDHIYSVSDRVKDAITPFSIRDELKLFGQKYTSDVKDAELTNEFRKFEEITFLGAHPKMILGKYCGALKKSTLWEMLHWTRNRDWTKDDEVDMAIWLSSVWEEEFFREFVTEALSALSCCDKLTNQIEPRSYQESREIVARRTVTSGLDYYYGFWAQDGGGTCTDNIPFFAQGPTIDNSMNQHSIVDLTSGKTIVGSVVNQSMKMKLSDKALNEPSLDLTFGTESRVFRSEFVWKTSDPVGTAIVSYDVPFGLLSLGNEENLQNMSFDRFAFWKGDVELVIQVNATPFQCGLLAVYFVPLASYEVELPNITACSHVLIQPDQNATYSLPIPFVYLRSVMNTRATTTESLGTVFVTPLAPLSAVDITSCTLTVFSSFPNSNFTIPRPLTTTTKVKNFTTAGGRTIPFVRKNQEIEFSSQGNSTSTIVTNSFSNVSGEMPIQDFHNDMTSSADIGVEASIPMPFDNPPLCSGMVPVGQSFSGMSASHGVRPTVDMQLKPAALSRQQCEIFDPSDSKIQTICGKKCLLTSFDVTTSMTPGQNLYECFLNTRMSLAEGSDIPINIVALNQFMFWRGDIEFEFVAVTTKFHSFRLMAVMSYGSESIDISSRNVNYSRILNFSSSELGTNYSDSWVVKFNAQTEFLRTYEGEGATDYVQNYGLGTMGVFLQNALIAPESVPPAVKVLVFVKFNNLKVAVPRPQSPFTIDNDLVYVPSDVFTFRGIQGVVNMRAEAGGIFTPPSTISAPNSNFRWDTVPPNGMYIPVDTERMATIGYIKPGGTASHRASLASLQIDGSTTKITLGSSLDPDTVSLIDLSEYGGSVSWIPVVFRAQSNEEEKVVVNDTPTTAELQDNTPVTSTLETTQDRPNVPCKLEIGEKFEFCVSDIHEIIRRYIRVVPGTNADLQQYTVLSNNEGDIDQNIINVGTQPQNFWRGMFAAWAGSIKYRIFTMGSQLTQVCFTPFYNDDPSTPGVPIIDAFQGTTFIYDGVGITTNTFLSGNIAREVAYPISDKSFIDISAPFQSHFNFCYTTNTQSVAPISSGTLSIVTDHTDYHPVIYTSAGDDLRFGVFRPPKKTNFSLLAYGRGIGGFYKDTPFIPKTLNKRELQ